MQRHCLNSLEWLTFDLFDQFPSLHHAVFLRSGGYSVGTYKGLNTSPYVGDKDQHVEKNLSLLNTHFKREISKWQGLKFGKACHSTALACVNQKSASELVDYDGLLTNHNKITLMMRHADCQIALFFDPVQHAIASVHAGWRGSVAQIYQKTIDQMRLLYGSNPSDLHVCISPSLGPTHAEFIHYKKELPESFWHFQVKPNYFDFWAISDWQLRKAGILQHHLEIAKIDTFSNSQDYFSYRKNSITGRNGTCITLKI